MTTHSDVGKWQIMANDKAPETLIIGDSVIKNISERGLHSVTMKLMSGARIGDVGHEISTKCIAVAAFKTIILHIGTNNCSDPGGLDRASDDYRGLLRVIRELAPGSATVVSTVCPRKDHLESQARVDRLNQIIRRVAQETGCGLVDNDDNFKMKDDSIDPSLLDKGGLHLTQAGTIRLLRNFQTAVPNIMRASDKAKHKRAHLKRRFFTGRKADVTHHGNRNSQNSHSRRAHAIGSCKYCGEKNHSASRCKFEEPLICHNCYGPGHKSWMCTVDRRKNRTRGDRKWWKMK